MKCIILFVILLLTILGIFSFFIFTKNKLYPSREADKLYPLREADKLYPSHKTDKFPPIEKFKNLDEPSKCIRTPYSKEYAQKILNSLKDDVNKVYPLNEFQLSFHPLECCTLEDSMTENKHKIFICVKDKQGKYYSYNKLLQVVLHELAHAKSKSVDPNHTSKEFLSNYNNLMNKASNMGIINLSKL